MGRGSKGDLLLAPNPPPRVDLSRPKSSSKGPLASSHTTLDRPASNVLLSSSKSSKFRSSSPRDSEALSTLQSVPLHFNFPPFCSGDWLVFVQWKGYKDPDNRSGSSVYGFDFADVEDRVTPLGGSGMLLERLNGRVIEYIPLLPTFPGAPPFFPFGPTGQLFLSDDLVPPPASERQVRIRIILEFESASVVCACRRRSTRRFDGTSLAIHHCCGVCTSR